MTIEQQYYHKTKQDKHEDENPRSFKPPTWEHKC